MAKKNSLPNHWQAASHNPIPAALLHVEKLYLNKVMDQEVHPANQQGHSRHNRRAKQCTKSNHQGVAPKLAHGWNDFALLLE